MAHLESLRTRGAPRRRVAAKLWLVKELFRRGYSRKEIGQLFRFIDWSLKLPEALDDTFRTQVRALEEEKHMPYVTSIERLGRKEGREEGIKEGIKEGLLNALRVSLEVRFGEPGLALLPELQAVRDDAVLIRVQEALVRGLSLEELRKIWQG